MSKEFKAVLAGMLFVGAILLVGCAAKQDEPVQQTPPPQVQQPAPTSPAPPSACKQSCQDESDYCDDDCYYYAYDDDDYDDCLDECESEYSVCIGKCN
jgi:hypothetical protein